MKKQLLLIPLISFAFIYANGIEKPTLTTLWEKIPNVNFCKNADSRQGIGINGKIYTIDKTLKKVYVFDGTSDTPVEIGDISTGGQGVTIDDANNLIVRNSGFSSTTGSKYDICVFDASTNYSTSSIIPISSDFPQASHYCGKASGNLLSEEGGEILFVVNTLTENNIFKAQIKDKTCISKQYYSTPSGILTDAQGIAYIFNNKIYYSPRRADANIYTIDAENKGAIITVNTPNRNTTQGIWSFMLDENEYLLYNTGTAYCDGFAIRNITTSTTVATHNPSITSPGSSSASNWTNFEKIDNFSGYIYSYTPGGKIAKYLFQIPNNYKSTPVTATSDVVLNDDNTDITDLNVTASWSTPTDLDASVTLTGYTVELYKGATLVKSENATSSATSAKFSSVIPGEEYTVKLTVNYTKAGVNKTSEITSAAITPDYAAAPVTNAKVTLSKDSKGSYGALIDFDKPTVSGGTPLPVSKYIIRRTGVSGTPNDIEVPSTFVRKTQTVGGQPIDYVHIDILPDQPSSVSYLIEAVYGATNANITKKASVDVTSTGVITGVEDNITVTATKIYPNPTDGLITINSAEAINRISIYSVTGAMVKEFSGNISESQSVDLRGMAPGIYFVKVNNLKPIQIILK